MNIRLAQLWGMTVYEFRMHWRRRGLIVMTLALLVMIGIDVLLTSSNREALIQQIAQLGTNGVSREEFYQVVSAAISFLSWATLGPTLAFVLPIIMADTIALDRQEGMSELFDSLPLPSSTYLTGKVFGSWAAALASLLIMTVFSTVVWELQAASYGISYDLRPYLGLSLVGGVSLILLNGSFGALVGGMQPSRRRAFILVAALAVLPSLVLGTGAVDGALWSYLNPLRGPMLTYYLNAPLAALNNPASTPMNLFPLEVVLTIVIGLAESAALWGLVWGWRRWREMRG